MCLVARYGRYLSQVRRHDITMVEIEIGIHSCPILDVRKETNGCDIDLDQTELAHFVGRVSYEGNGVTGKVEVDLWGITELGI